MSEDPSRVTDTAPEDATFSRDVTKEAGTISSKVNIATSVEMDVTAVRKQLTCAEGLVVCLTRMVLIDVHRVASATVLDGDFKNLPSFAATDSLPTPKPRRDTEVAPVFGALTTMAETRNCKSLEIALVRVSLLGEGTDSAVTTRAASNQPPAAPAPRALAKEIPVLTLTEVTETQTDPDCPAVPGDP